MHFKILYLVRTRLYFQRKVTQPVILPRDIRPFHSRFSLQMYKTYLHLRPLHIFRAAKLCAITPQYVKGPLLKLYKYWCGLPLVLITGSQDAKSEAHYETMLLPVSSPVLFKFLLARRGVVQIANSERRTLMSLKERLKSPELSRKWQEYKVNRGIDRASRSTF